MRRRNTRARGETNKEPSCPNEYFDEHKTATAVIISTDSPTADSGLYKAIADGQHKASTPVPEVREICEPVNTDTHFPKLSPLTNGHDTDIILKTRKHMPDQKTIDLIIQQLNDKNMHFYKLPFVLKTLRNSQRKDV